MATYTYMFFPFLTEPLTKPSEHLIVCIQAQGNIKLNRETKSYKRVIKNFL